MSAYYIENIPNPIITQAHSVPSSALIKKNRNSLDENKCRMILEIVTDCLSDSKTKVERWH